MHSIKEKIRSVEMKSAQNDMTVGNPMKIIFGFTLPIFIGNVFQQFYNMADAVIVGKFVGNKALAAVGSTGTIMFLIYGFVVGMTAGFTVLTAQKFGAGDMKGMRKTVAGAGILSFVVGALLTILFMAFMKPLLILMNTPSDIFADAYSYIMIVSGGILAQMLYNLLSSILRALGNSKLPLVFLIISALLNIVLDLAFIVGFGMGAKGAAVATVIAQGVSGILCLFYIIAKIPILHLKREDLYVGSTIYKNQLRIGVPMALQYSITAIGTMMVQSSLNILGSTLVAAYTAAGKIEQVVTQAYVAMGTTMATYAAQNMDGDIYKAVKKDNIMNNNTTSTDLTSAEQTSSTRQGVIVRLTFDDSPSAEEPLVLYAKVSSVGEKTVDIQVDKSSTEEVYYVYARGGLDSVWTDPAKAVQRADKQTGVVLNRAQQYVWERGNMKTQLTLNTTDIPEIIRTASLDVQNLQNGLGDSAKVVDLSGCSLENVLYEVSAQRAVIAKTGADSSVVIVGYDQYNTYLLDPSTGEVKPYGMNDSTALFQSAGNVFITYLDQK